MRKGEPKAEMRKRTFCWKVGFLSAQRETPPPIEMFWTRTDRMTPRKKKSVQNKGNRRFAQESLIINRDSLEVVSYFKKWAKTKISTTPSNIATRIAKMPLNCSHTKQPNKISAAKPLASADGVTIITTEVNKTAEGTPQSPETKSWPALHSDFHDHLYGRLPPGYTIPSTAIGNMCRSLVINCPQPVVFARWKLMRETRT